MNLIYNNKNLFKKGFSLLELMVVLAIIGLLSGIAVPIVLTVQRDSRDAQRLKQLDAIKIAAAKFYTEYNVDIDIYKGNSPCQSLVTENETAPTGGSTKYYICPQNAVGVSSKTIEVTLTDGYYLRRANTCGGQNVSKDKMVLFRIDRGSQGTQGFIILCKESGGEQLLEYKQG